MYDTKTYPDSQPHRSLYLSSGGWGEVTISQQGYEEIVAILLRRQVCTCCHRHFTADNRNVANTICHECVSAENSFVFLGEMPEAYKALSNTITRTAAYPIQCYYWLKGATGEIYWSQQGFDRSTTIYSDSRMTLTYWGFPIPKEYIDTKGNKISIHPGATWYPRGDLCCAETIIATNYQDVAFLLHKSGGITQISWRRKDHKALRDAAQRVIDSRWEAKKYPIIRHGEIVEWTGSLPSGELYNVMGWIMDCTMERLDQG
jgi:hypothetical protein